MNLEKIISKKLEKQFYLRNVTQIAADLLGCFLIKNDEGGIAAGKIVETEAYDGKIDEASHSFNGKTKRNSVMFDEGGKLYVYFTYGMYYCANVVTGKSGDGCAVLIRGVEPVAGLERMSMRRFGSKSFTDKQKLSLCNGPAKLCISFGIDKTHNGESLCNEKVFIVPGEKIAQTEIVTTGRIGIKKSVELKWRYYIKNNPYISRK